MRVSDLLSLGWALTFCTSNWLQMTLMLLVITYCNDDEDNIDSYDQDFSFTSMI